MILDSLSLESFVLYSQKLGPPKAIAPGSQDVGCLGAISVGQASRREGATTSVLCPVFLEPLVLFFVVCRAQGPPLSPPPGGLLLT